MKDFQVPKLSELMQGISIDKFSREAREHELMIEQEEKAARAGLREEKLVFKVPLRTQSDIEDKVEKSLVFSTSGKMLLATNNVTTTKIANDAVTAGKIKGSSIVASTIAGGVITLGTGAHKSFCGKLNAVFVSVNTATVGYSVAVSHGLGRTPIGKELIKISTLNGAMASKAALWCQGSTADTSTQIKVKSYATNARYKFKVY